MEEVKKQPTVFQTHFERRIKELHQREKHTTNILNKYRGNKYKMVVDKK